MNAIYEALIGTDRPWMPMIVSAVAAFIGLVLYLDLRSLRLVCLALTPVVAASTVTLGVLAAAGFSFNTVTLVAVPLLLGLGVDDGIHVIHRMLEQPNSPLRVVVGSVARSIALTTLTTCGSVGLLVFTRHPGIESVAILLLVGLPLCLLASVTLLPAAIVAMRAQAIGQQRALARKAAAAA
jgi:predicted RND superfamily exporter protein